MFSPFDIYSLFILLDFACKKKGVCCVNTLFGETLRKMRMEKGLSQVKLAKELFVYNSTVAR